MTTPDLASRYRAYLACLNARDWSALGQFVAGNVTHNGRPFGLAGYRAMLEQDIAAIPDLRFVIAMLVVEPPRVACRLQFDCTPRGTVLGIPVNGRTVQFCENVFYEWQDDLIATVWSVIDKGAIEAQLKDA